MDLMPYICPPNGQKYRLFGLGDEHCQCVLMPDGGIDFRKNKHYEAFRVDGQYIYRAEDTSMISRDGVNPYGTYYALFTRVGDKLVYGSKWIKRNMLLGEFFYRNPVVRIFNYNGKELVTYDDPSYITFRDYHQEYMFRSGIRLRDVIELQWSSEEVYLYAKGYGLVAWKNIRSGVEGSWIGAFGANIQPSFAVPITRPQARVDRLNVPLNDRLYQLIEHLK